MADFRIVICGGGVAGLEGLLRVRRLVGDAADIVLVAPNEEFAFRALAVNEPFGYRSAPRYPLEPIVRDAGAEWVRDKLAGVDRGPGVIRTQSGAELPFDAALLAVGAEVSPAYEHVTTFNDAHADELFNGIVRDVEEGYLRSLCLVAPPSPIWPLPLYELAFMTAERAYDMNIDDFDLSVVTPEPAPLNVFGRVVSDAVAKRLGEARIQVHADATPKVPGPRELVVRPGGETLHPTRIVALPRLSGPQITGVPTRMGRFIPIDRHCLVPDAGGSTFAAGDATSYPVKHGGIGAQQADTAAEGIARLAGVEVDPHPFHPEIRGVLFTGRSKPLYIWARGLISGEGFDSQVSDEPLWEPADKVAAEDLGRYLAGRRDP